MAGSSSAGTDSQYMHMIWMVQIKYILICVHDMIICLCLYSYLSFICPCQCHDLQDETRSKLLPKEKQTKITGERFVGKMFESTG